VNGGVYRKNCEMERKSKVKQRLKKSNDASFPHREYGYIEEEGNQRGVNPTRAFLLGALLHWNAKM